MKTPAVILLIMLVSSPILVATITNVSASTIHAGVFTGEIFEYSYNLNWTSTNPTLNPPTDLVDYNNTQKIQFIITNVSGSNITLNFMRTFKNGSSTVQSGLINLDSGTANVPYGFLIIGADLNKNDRIYPSGGYQVITDTVNWSYPTGLRETNILSGADSSGSTTIYFDKIKGVAVDYSYQISQTSGSYTTVSTERMINTNSGNWTVIPEFPTFTLPLILLAVSASLYLVKRKNKPSSSNSK
jgi:hypothetical protein